jgi:hypothetical protein
MQYRFKLSNFMVNVSNRNDIMKNKLYFFRQCGYDYIFMLKAS